MTERIALDLPDSRVLDVQVSGPADGNLLIWHRMVDEILAHVSR